MKSGKKGIKSKNIFWGVFLVLAAVFLIVSQLGLVEGVGVVSILFGILFFALLIDGLVRGSIGTVLFSIAFLCIVFDKPLGIEAITPWAVLGAALLGTIGLNMVFKKKKHIHVEWYDKREKQNENDQYVDSHIVDEEKHTENGLNGSRVFFKNSFGESVKYINSDNFEFAALECSFGTMKVYFDNTSIPSGNATVELDVSFGGVELYFPGEWTVVDHTDTSFGGVDEKNTPHSVGGPVVTLTGDVSFSGVTIIYI